MTRAVVRSLVAVAVWSAYGCMGLFAVGDGSLGIRGVVYRAHPSEASSIAIDVESASTHDRAPLSGCVVVLEPWSPRTRPRSDETRTRLTKRTKTDGSGRFEAGGTAKPGNYDVTVSVSCPGVGEVQRVFRHDRQGTHEVTVIVASGV